MEEKNKRQQSLTKNTTQPSSAMNMVEDEEPFGSHDLSISAGRRNTSTLLVVSKCLPSSGKISAVPYFG